MLNKIDYNKEDVILKIKSKYDIIFSTKYNNINNIMFMEKKGQVVFNYIIEKKGRPVSHIHARADGEE